MGMMWPKKSCQGQAGVERLRFVVKQSIASAFDALRQDKKDFCNQKYGNKDFFLYLKGIFVANQRHLHHFQHFRLQSFQSFCFFCQKNV